MLQVLGRAPVQPMVWDGCHGSIPRAAAPRVDSAKSAGRPYPSRLVEAPPASSSRQQINHSMMYLPHQHQTEAVPTPLCGVHREYAPDSSCACLGSFAPPRASPVPHGSCFHALGQSSNASPPLLGPNTHTQAQQLQRLPGSPEQQLGRAFEDATSRLTGSAERATSARPEITLTFEMCTRSEPSCH